MANITTVKSTTEKINTIKSNDGSLTWINIIDAQKKEIDYLKRKFKFNKIDLDDSFAAQYAQRPKFNVRDGYSFMILQFPAYDKKTKIIAPEEIDFFIGPNYIITIHKNNLSPLANLFDTCLTDKFYREQYMTDGNASLIYEIILRLQEYCYPILDHISMDIKKIEENIFANMERQMISEILHIKRNIFSSRKILEAHKNAIQKISKDAVDYIYMPNLKIYYTNLIDHTKNIWEILQGQKELIESLEDTNETMVSFKLNQIMKTLTIFSVTMFPLTLLAAIFGMNTVHAMPFINNPNGFWWIIGIMFLGSMGMFAYFKKRDWL